MYIYVALLTQTFSNPERKEKKRWRRKTRTIFLLGLFAALNASQFLLQRKMVLMIMKMMMKKNSTKIYFQPSFRISSREKENPVDGKPCHLSWVCIYNSLFLSLSSLIFTRSVKKCQFSSIVHKSYDNLVGWNNNAWKYIFSASAFINPNQFLNLHFSPKKKKRVMKL